MSIPSHTNQRRFTICLPITLAHEGGYKNDQGDPGNWNGDKVGCGVLKGTKFGNAARSFPDLDIRNLTQAEVGPAYRKNCEAYRSGAGLCVYDAATDSGPSRVPAGRSRSRPAPMRGPSSSPIAIPGSAC